MKDKILCHREFKAMGSPCELKFYVHDRKSANAVAEAVIADVLRLERRYSRYRDDSLLAEINRTAALGGSITVDEETASLLNYAVACYQQSDGLFDITSGILRAAWRFDRGSLPDQGLIDRLLEKVGWHQVVWSPPALTFSRAGMELDFGGIVKEYAVDRVATLSREAGIRHGVINLGGDIRVIGPFPDGSPWHIGIRHPRQADSAIETLAVHQGAMATSGDYERCLVVDDVRYAHVLNPKTGWPVRHLASVSVIGELCVVAGSASTIAMLKEEQGPAWLQELGLPHYWVDIHGRVGGSLLPS